MQYVAQTQQSENTINTTIPYTPPVEEKPDSSLLLPIGSAIAIGLLIVVAVVLLRRRKRKSTVTPNQASLATATPAAGTIDKNTDPATAGDVPQSPVS